MADRNFFLIAYDLGNDKRRAKLARLLESYGARVQGSVFEVYLTEKELQEFQKKSKKLINEKVDSLRIYILCENCKVKIIKIGLDTITQTPGLVIV